MDKAEFKRVIKDLVESSKGPKHQDTVSLLTKLKVDATVSEELLKETKAGLTVGKLRSHQDANVQDAAKELVRKWKTEVETQKKSGVKGTPKPAPKPTVQTSLPPSVSTLKSPVPGTPHSPGKNRSAKDDGITISTTGDKTRDKCIEMLYDSLAIESNAPSELILKRATEVESSVSGIFKGDHGNPYRQKIRSLYLNLKDKQNPSLREAVVSGDLTVRRFCQMTNQEMASEDRKAESAKLEEINLFKAKGAEEAGAETDAFKCFRCGQRKTRYTQAQTRSADEPMTTFVTCVNCGNRWKFS